MASQIGAFKRFAFGVAKAIGAGVPPPPAPGTFAVVKHAGTGLRLLDTFERYELPPARERVRGWVPPRILPAGAEVSIEPERLGEALEAGMAFARWAA